MSYQSRSITLEQNGLVISLAAGDTVVARIGGLSGLRVKFLILQQPNSENPFHTAVVEEVVGSQEIGRAKERKDC